MSTHLAIKAAVFGLKLILLLLVAVSIGLVFAITPCYLFPYFGASMRVWCGFKGLGDHFVASFVIGALLGLVAISYGLLWRSRPPKP